MKKSFFSLLTLLLLLCAGQSYANIKNTSLYFEDFSISPGEEIKLPIMFDGNVTITQVQFKLTAPEGFEFVNKGTARKPSYLELNNNSETMAPTVKVLDGNTLSAVLSDGDQIGTEFEKGILAYIFLKASETLTPNVYIFQVKDVVCSDADANVYKTPDASVTVTVAQKYTLSVTSANTEFGTVAVDPVQEIYLGGTSVTATATPVEGYHFVKWSDEATDNPYTFTVNADTQLTATFAPNQYTATFVLDNGEENIVKTQDYKSALTAPADPTKTGYTFTGWNPAVPETMPLNGGTYTAQWTINQYTITFDTDGGSEVAAITQDYNTAVTAPADPTKTGYTFAGWEPALPTTIPAENITVKAKWTINQYTITFDTDGGTEIAAITQDYNTAVTAPADPTKTGYTFAGWDKEIPATIPAENITIKALWTINQYTITFDTDGGSEVAAITQDYNTAVTAPADPTKEGYTFAGWDKEIPTTMPAEDITVKAQWNPITYTITYELNGGQWNPAETEHPETYTIEDEITLPTPVRNYYEEFAGWTEEGSSTPIFAIVKGTTGNKVFTALFTVSDGINAVMAKGTKADVYTIDGRLVKRGMTAEEAASLKRGLYIVNGKKVAVK